MEGVWWAGRGRAAGSPAWLPAAPCLTHSAAAAPHPAHPSSPLPKPIPLYHQMEGMVNDLQLAREKQAAFDSWRAKSGQAAAGGIDLTITVLTTGFWPTYKARGGGRVRRRACVGARVAACPFAWPNARARPGPSTQPIPLLSLRPSTCPSPPSWPPV